MNYCSSCQTLQWVQKKKDLWGSATSEAEAAGDGRLVEGGEGFAATAKGGDFCAVAAAFVVHAAFS